jgi:hypothetical protein
MTDIKHTPGPWQACNMVHEDGRPMTPEELGEYVCNAVKKSNETRFLFVSGNDGDGNVDVCHVGNGPNGPANVHLIAAAPDMYEALVAAEKAIDAYIDACGEIVIEETEYGKPDLDAVRAYLKCANALEKARGKA